MTFPILVTVIVATDRRRPGKIPIPRWPGLNYNPTNIMLNKTADRFGVIKVRIDGDLAYQIPRTEGVGNEDYCL